MREEQIALAKRCVACKSWRLMPGMRTHRGETIDCVDVESGQAYCGDFDVVIGALPDLTDPATLGCLLALVREAHGQTTLSPVSGGKRRWFLADYGTTALQGESEAELLVAALEAAP